ncbi:hypothetical protein BC938DRAFT_478213 [Jimgerdemannia flammicorona]|uniref:Galactose oxidase n=1 Tax=Jimgerdemannia flammicorona TaxID=994334 RepID=A0A433QN95_9FUNG|nr:hypothetical protein BC938DRAFT_478213 [Jimgerdemannia flammicorona]
MANPIFQTLLVLLVVMAHLVTAFTPPGEWGQTAVLIQDIIYVYGGAHPAEIGMTIMYTLDVSQSWNTTAPAWTDHSSDGGNFTRPRVAFHTMWPSDDEESFYVWGGGNIFPAKPTLCGFAQYNIANKSWSLPSDSAAVNMPPPRRETVASWSSSGIAYIWGGYGDTNTGQLVDGYLLSYLLAY